MPGTIQELVYVTMSALIVLGIGIIAWLLNKGFESIKAQLEAIHQALDKEHEERVKLRAEFHAMEKVCIERHKAIDQYIAAMRAEGI